MKEKQTIHRLCPCHHYDIEGIQTWLEDMAKEGWMLEQDGYGLGLFTFQKDHPTRCRYRMEVVFEGKKTYQDRLEYLELLKDFGWSHITEFQGFEIFRTEDLNAPEISTDPVIQASTLKKLKKESTHRMVFFGVYFLMFRFRRRFGFLYLFRSAAVMGPLSVAAFLSFMVFAFTIPAFDLWMIRKIENTLRSGELLCNRKTWKKHALWHRIYDLAPLLWGTVCICILIGSFLMASDRKEIGTHISDPPFITVEDLAEDRYQLDDPPLSGNNYYVYWSNPVAPVNYEWREYAKFTADGIENNGFLIVNYHETANEWVAQGLADDYYEYETSRDQDSQDLEVEDYGLDQVRVFGSYGNYDILIRHGSIVIHASYSQWNGGEIPDWQIWLEAMAQMLRN